MLTIGIILYSLIRLFHPSVDKGPKGKGHPINPSIKKDCPKVVDVVDVEDLDKEKVSYCRCWKSKKVCNRSHVFTSCLLMRHKVDLLNCLASKAIQQHCTKTLILMGKIEVACLEKQS